MDLQDYAELIGYLHKAAGHPINTSRSPVLALNDAPIQPGWNGVLVLWDATEVIHKPGQPREIADESEFRLEILGYCPMAERGWSSKTDPNFRNDIDPDVRKFTSISEAFEAFAEQIKLYAEECKDVFG